MQLLLTFAAGSCLYFVQGAVTFLAHNALIDSLVNVVIPAAYSLRSLRRRNYQEQERWLVYWCVRGGFHLLSE
eukprot:4810344-Pyramimonas_sp.AAC.1